MRYDDMEVHKELTNDHIKINNDHADIVSKNLNILSRLESLSLNSNIKYLNFRVIIAFFLLGGVFFSSLTYAFMPPQIIEVKVKEKASFSSVFNTAKILAALDKNDKYKMIKNNTMIDEKGGVWLVVKTSEYKTAIKKDNKFYIFLEDY